MSWDQVISQGRAKDVLRRAITQDRVAHAYLFHGPYGTGKRAAAFAFARALQCKVAPGEGCMTCSDCSRINRMMHPDVRFFLPLPKDMEVEEIVKRMTDLGANPYDTVDFIRRPTAKSANKQVIFRKEFIVEDVRPVVDFIAFEGAYKVVVLLDAEALGDDTGNVFLKLLEEPSPRSVFILITDRPDRLLPTILSRCQPIRFDPVPAADIARALIEREGRSEVDAASISRLADGSFSTARDLLHDETARGYRERLVPFMRAVYLNQVDYILELIDGVSSQTRDEVRLFLGLVLVLIRDLILVRELGPEAPIVNVHEREALVKFVKNLPNPRLEQMVNLVEEAWYLITRNVNSKLVLTTLTAGLRASMKGDRALPLVTPLAEQLLSDLE
ncbi:MAG TPA: DNA polymerase III subunit delta' [Rhodothermia bacterium]